MQHVPVLRPLRLLCNSIVLAGAALLALSAPATASAQSLLTETFSNVPMNSQRVRIDSDIAGTGLKVTSGVVEIRTDPIVPGRDNYMWMPLGAYQPAPYFDPVTNIGPASFQATSGFDLFAGVQYTLSFDWTRTEFSGGNGPFPYSLTAHLGSRSLVLNDDAGFYYGLNWQTATLTFTPTITELGAIVSFAGTGIGYSGLYIDNISMVGVGAPPPTNGAPAANVVPEPSTYVLTSLGLVALTLASSRRKKRWSTKK